jgi:hypothetical protein
MAVFLLCAPQKCAMLLYFDKNTPKYLCFMKYCRKGSGNVVVYVNQYRLKVYPVRKKKDLVSQSVNTFCIEIP